MKGKRLIITGGTGTGKTYKTIMSEKRQNRKFCYVAPCRQLVYETYIKYGNLRTDKLSTGEIKMGATSFLKNFFGVYESISEEDIKNCETLIIDEAHYINDFERGKILKNLIKVAARLKKGIRLVTATPNFEINMGFKTIKNKPFCEVPTKKEILFEESLKNIKRGMQTIWFTSSINKALTITRNLVAQGVNAKAMVSSMAPSERLDTQINFANKKIQVIVSTNLLAQGVNFECQNLIIEDDCFNNKELVEQKLGRLGRPGTLNGANKVYYSIFKEAKSFLMAERKTEKLSSIKKEEKISNTFKEKALKEAFNILKVIDLIGQDPYVSDYKINNETNWGVPQRIIDELREEVLFDKWNVSIPYNTIKYCILEFKNLNTDKLLAWGKQAYKNTLKQITNEETSLREIILKAMGKSPKIKVTSQEVYSLLEGIREAEEETYSPSNLRKKEKIQHLKEKSFKF